MDGMQDFFREINEEMQLLTEQSVTELTNMWRRLFVPAMCEDNLKKLLSHTKSYYHDLIMESQRKTASIEQELADLQEEAETLCRLLNTSVYLPPRSGDTPLLQVQDEMDKSLTELREMLRQRREEICELLLVQESLCEELGENPRPLAADPLPTAMELDEFRSYLKDLKEQRMERLNELSTLRREIKGYLQMLELSVSTECEQQLLNERVIKLDKETFSGLQRMRKNYGEQVEKMKIEIDGIRKKVETLWDRLNTSPNTRNKLQRHTDITQYTYDIYYGELQRCEALKSQNIKHYVQQVRAEIIELWDKTLKSEKQRSRFVYFNNSCYTDDLLSLHELELDDLKSFYNENREIFELFENRKILWDRMIALETKATDPARYNNRGGQLLREEKERKTIATKLPKIESQIRDLVQAYEEREQKAFLVYGENIVDVMAAEWLKKQEEKEKISTARKRGQTPQSKSQLITAGRTPLSLKNASSISLRKAPSTTSLASGKATTASATKKRKLNPTEKHTPSAKRSLMNALKSPLDAFIRPPASTQKNRVKSSPGKKPKVIGTMIRRKSGRHNTSNSSQAKKRRSIVQKVPKIVIEDGSDHYTEVDDESDWDGAAVGGVMSSSSGGVGIGGVGGVAEEEFYDTFEKCLDPSSRSSTIVGTRNIVVNNNNNNKRAKRMVHIPTTKSIPENMQRTTRLGTPRTLRTPSSTAASSHHTLRSGYESSTSNRTAATIHQSPIGPGSSRKLTTKNLPIII